MNASERAIQTFKNHLIAGLCTTDKLSPLQLWDMLVKKTEDTLNMLRTVQADPYFFVYAYPHCNFDFNRTPLAHPSTKAIIYNAQKNDLHLQHMVQRLGTLDQPRTIVGAINFTTQ